MKTQSKESQDNLNTEQALNILKDGNQRFVNNLKASRNLLQQVNETSSGQFPYAVVLSCIDSRIPTEIVFDQGIGDIFNARIAGNFVNEDILGSMEFACKLSGAKIIVVMGHTSCGAIKGACDGAELGNLTQMLDKMKPAVTMTKTAPDEKRNSSNIDFVNKVAVNNVKLTIENILSKSPVLAELHKNGTINIAGAMYAVESGKVDFLN